MNLKKKSLENIKGKGENAGKQHFLFFPCCFSITLSSNLRISAKFNLISLKACNFDISRIFFFW